MQTPLAAVAAAAAVESGGALVLPARWPVQQQLLLAASMERLGTAAPLATAAAAAC